jgi:hypothetical protein
MSRKPTEFFQDKFYAPMLFASVREVKRAKSKRKRQCFKCGDYIQKDEVYVIHQYRYDKTILAAYFHDDCYHEVVVASPVEDNKQIEQIVLTM